MNFTSTFLNVVLTISSTLRVVSPLRTTWYYIIVDEVCPIWTLPADYVLYEHLASYNQTIMLYDFYFSLCYLLYFFLLSQHSRLGLFHPYVVVIRALTLSSNFKEICILCCHNMGQWVTRHSCHKV